MCLHNSYVSIYLPFLLILLRCICNLFTITFNFNYMDPLKGIKKLKSQIQVGKPSGNSKNGKNEKRIEFRLKVNLWKILIAGMLFLFFLPFLISVFQLQLTQ